MSYMYCPPRKKHAQPKGKEKKFMPPKNCQHPLPPSKNIMVYPLSWENPRGIEIYYKYPWEKMTNH